MRRTMLALTLTSGLALGLPPAGAIAPAGFDCGPDDGREQLTTSGMTRTFQAPFPASAGHDLGEAAYPEVGRAHAMARFDVRTNLAPYTSGDLKLTLAWAGRGDFDLYVYDADGNELDSSVTFNPTDGNGERIDLTEVAHCADLTIGVMNYAGHPDEPVTLAVQFLNPGPAFACEEEDPHPACAGKAAGEAPSMVPDTRTRLYLGGDRPGQLAMQGHYAFGTAGAGQPPLKATLSSTRPMGGRTNTFTKLAAGNPEQHENPFFANFSYAVTQPTRIAGTVQAVLWVSSQTFPRGGGPLFVDLWADGTGPLAGTKLARVEVPGTAIRDLPSRVRVSFTGLDAVIESELVLQVSSEPVVTSGGVVGDPNDAEWTIYYDSVQFPSHLTLAPPTPAE